MDLSNRQSADYWHKRAEEVEDPDLRKEALSTFREYRKLAIREEKLRLRTQRPGYGVRSMFGWIVLVALVVLAAILALSKVFTVALVCGVFVFALALCVVAAAVTLRVHGHISEDSMLAMIQRAMTSVGAKKATAAIDASSGEHEDYPPASRARLPSNAPVVSFNDDDEASR